MKKTFILNFAIGALIVLVYLAYRYSRGGIGLLSSQEARQKIKSGEIEQVVDVRTSVEYSLGHYPESVNIPLGSLTKEKADKLPDKGILTVCNTGHRARRAAEILRSFGKEDVYYINGTYKNLI